MASTVWKGHLTFGLVSIPVRLFLAARRERINLHQLRRRDESGESVLLNVPDAGHFVVIDVLESRLLRHELLQMRLDVARDIGIGALVDRHACSRVGDEHVTSALRDA